ncbi:MAG: cohesin domain-containing protein, partial [Patescibacteria group bacterium]
MQEQNKKNLITEPTENIKLPQNKLSGLNWFRLGSVVLVVGIAVSLVGLIFVLVVNENNKMLVKQQVPLNIMEQESFSKNSEDVLSPLRGEHFIGTMELAQTDDEIIKNGDEFNIDILISTNEADIVLAQAVIVYDATRLQLQENDVLSAGKEQILGMNIETVIKDGEITIVRGAPGDSDYKDKDDGYNGERGLLASLTFKALQSGDTEISFAKKCVEASADCAESQMILDDGLATPLDLMFEDIKL